MPTTIPIVLSNVSPTASAVSVTNVIRSDTGAPPAGISLPIALTFGGGQWTGSFTDTLPPASYTATATLTEGGVVSLPFQWTVKSPGGAVGAYTTQALIEQTFQIDGDIWSNTNNNTAAPNQVRYQSAINSVESIINGRIMDEFYSTPIPPTSPQFARLSEIATKLAGTELYFAPRGLQDGGAVGGQLSVLRDWGYAELDRILSRPVSGVTRNFPSPAILVPSDCAGNPRPAVSNVVSPELYPPWFWGFGGAPFGLW